jgi:hypothetical protein
MLLYLLEVSIWPNNFEKEEYVAIKVLSKSALLQ